MNQRKLEGLGWDFLVVWECELKDVDMLGMRLIEFLGEQHRSALLENQ